jgi:hypothetical protein
MDLADPPSIGPPLACSSLRRPGKGRRQGGVQSEVGRADAPEDGEEGATASSCEPVWGGKGAGDGVGRRAARRAARAPPPPAVQAPPSPVGEGREAGGGSGSCRRRGRRGGVGRRVGGGVRMEREGMGRGGGGRKEYDAWGPQMLVGMGYEI